MTLNAKIGVFINFCGDFGLRDTCKEQIAPKSIKIDIDNLHTKFSTLNVDFDSLSLVFWGSRKPAHKGIKERYPVKVAILPLLASLS